MIRDVDSVQDAERLKTIRVLIRRLPKLIPGGGMESNPHFCSWGS